jgi:hypothetical protein
MTARHPSARSSSQRGCAPPGVSSHWPGWHQIPCAPGCARFLPLGLPRRRGCRRGIVTAFRTVPAWRCPERGAFLPCDLVGSGPVGRANRMRQYSWRCAQPIHRRLGWATVYEDAKGHPTRDYEVRRAVAQAMGIEVIET